MSSMSVSRSFLFLAVAGLLLSACGDIREDLGLGRNVPDEFAVVDRPPLSMPPDFSLRPPRPGIPRPQEMGTDQQASSAVFGEKGVAKKQAPSSSEQALLEASGASKADSNIRDVVDRESAQKVAPSEHLVDRLLNWRDNQPPSTTLDAQAEAERIKKAQDNNELLNEGATPVIEKKKSGWLGL